MSRRRALMLSPPVQWLGLMRGLTRAAPTRAAGLRNALMFAVIPLLQPVLQRAGRQLVVRVGLDGARHDFHIDSAGDLRVLYEVWAVRVYDVPPLQSASTVIDAGANIGASVAFFKARSPNAVVHAYEPDPASFRKLVRNVGWLAGVGLHREAIWTTDGETVLYSSRQGWDSSLIERRGRPIRVACRTLDSARRDAGLDRVDLVKLDIEGAEFEVLRTPGALAGVNALVAELHLDLVPGSTVREARNACHGFRVTVTSHSELRKTLVAAREPLSGARAPSPRASAPGSAYARPALRAGRRLPRGSA
jgi:FkbM family methyltransferase